MPAGPYPTKVMHEALKTRVDTLESAEPVVPVVPGSSSGPAYLSDQVTLDTTGTRAIDPAEIPDGGLARKAQITFGPSAPTFLIDVVENGFSQGFAGISISIFSSQAKADLGDADLLSDSQIGGGASVRLENRVTVGPGAIIYLDYGQYQTIGGDLAFKADPLMPPDVAYVGPVVSDGGSPVPGVNVAIPLKFIEAGNVYGTLAPDAMNVVDAPSLLPNGGFEIVDPGNAPPKLRYRSSSGTVYALPMTAEV